MLKIGMAIQLHPNLVELEMECECGWNVTLGCFKLSKSFLMFFAAGLNDMCSSKPMHLIDESLPWRFKILCNSQRILFDRAGLNKSK